MPRGSLRVLSSVAVAAACGIVGVVGMGGCSSPSKPAHAPIAADALHQPQRVYVADFYLSPEQVQSEHLLPRPSGGPRPLRDMLDNARGEDPADRAKRLVRSLSESIVEELRSSGVSAEYLAGRQSGFRQQFIPADADLPKQGWIVSGWFEKADAGNRAAEATIGLGTGNENVRIEVAVSDLTGNVAEPFLFMGSSGDDVHLPGGLIARNPYVVAAKFVLSRDDMEKDVKEQGKMIARKLVAYMNTGAMPVPPKK